jgi:HK97 family phage major capsid protein
VKENEMADIRPPRDNLVRAMAQGFEVSDDGKTLFGRIAPANEWSEIRSSVEGHFMERNAPGAFKKTFAENMPKIMFNHGKDPQLGNQLIAEPREVGEDEQGGYYRAELLDGVPPLIVDGLKRGLYGSSHTFGVVREDFVARPKKSDYNPNGLPERTILEARVMELGPVTWPAYAGSVAGVRSMTDEFALTRLADDPDHLRDLADYVDPTPEPAPSDDAGESHLEPERREEPPVTPVTPERNTVDDKYVTREEKASRISELKDAITRTGNEFPGVMPTEVEARWNADNAEHDALVKDVAAWDARQARIATLASNPANTEPTYSAPNIVKKVEDIYDMGAIRTSSRSLDEVQQRTKEYALRSLESTSKSTEVTPLAEIVEYRDSGTDSKGEVANRILATGSPVYRRAYSKYLQYGSVDYFTPEESASFRNAALAVVGTTTTGGYAVPYVFDPTMIRIGAYTAQNPYRSACRVETISNGNVYKTVTVANVTSAYVAEPTAATEQGPTFGQPSFTVYRAHAFATVSFETLQDRPDIAPELTAVFAESKATYEENQFTLGVGTTVFPQGMFLSGAYTVKATATNDVTALLDFTATEGDIPLRFRANAVWFMNRSTIRQLQILDTTYRYFTGAGIQFPGNPQPNATGSNGGGNTGLQLLGYPIWEVPSAVSTLTTDAAVIAVLCDPKTFVIVDRIGMNVEVIPNMLNGATPSFPTGERGIYMYWRNTARPLIADGGRQVKVQ